MSVTWIKSRLNVLWYNRNINHRQVNKYYCSREWKPQNKLTFTQNFSWSLDNWCGTVKSWHNLNFQIWNLWDNEERLVWEEKPWQVLHKFYSFSSSLSMIGMTESKKNGNCIILYERKWVTWNCFSQRKIVEFQMEMKQNI